MASYWLIKSEPETYSIDDLARDERTAWEGVRNYQARNHLRAMKAGDLALFYHSSSDPSGVAGIARIAKEAYPDPSAFDPKSDYYDEATSPDDPRWFLVDVEFVAKLTRIVPLAELKADPALTGMEVTRKGSRLSVSPVSKPHFERIKKLGAKSS